MPINAQEREAQAQLLSYGEPISERSCANDRCPHCGTRGVYVYSEIYRGIASCNVHDISIMRCPKCNAKFSY